MFQFKSKKVILPLLLSALSVLLSPSLAQAEETYGTGNIASTRAAEQRAAIAERKERIKKEKEAEAAQKAVEAQQGKPAEAQTPAEGLQEKPAAQ